MNFLGIKHFHGESIFLEKPAVVASIEIPENENAAIAESLSNFQSSLNKDFPRSEGFTYKKIAEADSATVFCQCTIELLAFLLQRFNLAYCDISHKKFQTDIEHIIVAEQHKKLCEVLLHYAFFYTASFLPKNLFSGAAKVDLVKNLRTILNEIEKRVKDKTTIDLQRSLHDLNKPWFSLDSSPWKKNFLQIGFGKKLRILDSSVSFNSSQHGIEITKNKILTNYYLSQLGFPFPKQTSVKSLNDAIEKSRDIGFPLVLKSSHGAFGDFVVCDIDSTQELAKHFKHISNASSELAGRSLLIEQQLNGKVYRVEIVYGEHLATYQSMPASVVGNGKDTIATLIEKENLRPERNLTGQKAVLKPLKLGDTEHAFLAKQNYTEASIPDAGTRVFLRTNSNWSSGGEFIDNSEGIHPDNIDLLAQLSAQLDIDILGIDVICEDISKSCRESEFHIIEVNHRPGIFFYEEDKNGKSKSTEFAQVLSKNIHFGDVPVINCVSGNTSSAVDCEALSAQLEKESDLDIDSIAVIDQEKVLLKGKFFCPRSRIDASDPQLALLQNRLVGGLILERSSEELLENGIGSGGCDISIITELKNQNLSCSFLKQGFQQKALYKMLASISRQACIIFLEQDSETALLNDFKSENLFLISLTPFQGDALKAIHKGAKGIELQSIEGEQLFIRYFHRQAQENLTISHVDGRPEQSILGFAVGQLLKQAQKQL